MPEFVGDMVANLPGWAGVGRQHIRLGASEGKEAYFPRWMQGVWSQHQSYAAAYAPAQNLRDDPGRCVG
jgi:hypothetical protein